ncbi:dynein heavy chain 2 [Fusobacterium polymorphum]|uniref:dynein heavy chain 2 n=1 Tax=Fusobacterium nucleatum subsp. polymorphum TaxID=76857 RepID=UPI0030D1A6E1
MNKIRITHKDGDMQGITLIFLINKYLKINRSLWDKENMVLNRYYKAILTRTITASEKIVNKYEKNINYNAEKEVIKVLDEVFEAYEYKEKEDNLEILKTMFYVLVIFGTLNKHKKMMIGVVLKSMITDMVNTFKDFKAMWLREIDDNALRLEE